MRLSEDKISHLAHLFKEAVIEEKLGTIPDTNLFLNATKKVLTQYCKLDEEIENMVRKKIASYSKTILEGSREWDVLYHKHFQEELKKRW
ncbi:MAG: DUF507 family protein [Bdellovibrionales bacterium]|nr:DUF507 family protein [Bdellovibrionales bacterium]